MQVYTDNLENAKGFAPETLGISRERVLAIQQEKRDPTLPVIRDANLEYFPEDR